MTSKLLILHGEAKSDCFTISSVPESMFNYLKLLHSNFVCFDMLRTNIIANLSHVNKNKGVAD